MDNDKQGGWNKFTGAGFDRKGVCDKYRDHLWQQIKAGEVSLNDLAALHGKDLVCFCAPCQCHGHTLEKAAGLVGSGRKGA